MVFDPNSLKKLGTCEKIHGGANESNEISLFYSYSGIVSQKQLSFINNVYETSASFVRRVAKEIIPIREGLLLLVSDTGFSCVV